jgi:hypothetical protein
LYLRKELAYKSVTYNPEVLYDSTTDFLDEIPEYDEIHNMTEPAIAYMANQENVSV